MSASLSIDFENKLSAARCCTDIYSEYNNEAKCIWQQAATLIVFVSLRDSAKITSLSLEGSNRTQIGRLFPHAPLVRQSWSTDEADWSNGLVPESLRMLAGGLSCQFLVFSDQ